MAEIPPDWLESELGNVVEFLSPHDISVDCLAGVSNEELCRFITSELIHHEIDDIRIEGVRHCFIYEEFHPNDEYEAKMFDEIFLFHLLDRHEESAIHDVAEDEVYKQAGNCFTREEMADLK